MFHFPFLIRDILFGLFERQRASRKAAWAMVLGAMSFVLFAIVGFQFFFPTKPPPDDLASVDGIVSGAWNEKGHKGDPELVVSLDGTDVRMRSSHPYPSKFRFGSRTPDHLRSGERVTFLLHRSELERAPRKHRLHNYRWREFVGMSGESSVHLTPENHESWHQGNRAMGRVFFPILSLVGMFLFFQGYLARGKIRKGSSRV